MKKTIKFAALALTVMALTVACKSKAEQVEDTTPVEEAQCIEAVVDSIVDTTVAEVAEEVTPAVKKATTKKVEEKKGMSTVSGKQEIKTTAEDQAAGRIKHTQTLQNDDVKASSSKGEIKSQTAEQNAVGRLNNRK